MTTTLTQPAFSAVLDELFALSDAPPSPQQRAALAHIPAEDRRSMSMSTTDYEQFYAAAKDFAMAVSRETAQLLYTLVRATGASEIVEFGTSFGVSTLHLAAALRDNGSGGRVITSEFEPSKAARARDNFARAGLVDLIELREGDVLQTLATDLPDSIDLVVMDGAKGLYAAVLSLLEPRLAPGALILSDDADRSPDFVARVRSGADGYLSLPVGEDVELTLRA